MSKITILAMTKKGCDLVAGLSESAIKLIDLVVVGQDKNVENDYSEDIAAISDARGLQWEFRKDDLNISTEYAFAIGWRWMVKHPEDKLIVFHDSLLPRYRGFSPLVTALINGDEEIGVSALFGSNEYDKGKLLEQSSVEVNYPIKISEAINLMATCYISCAEKIIDKIKSDNHLVGVAQSEIQATYSVWRDDDDYYIDWRDSAEQLVRFINAVGYPYKGARTRINGDVIIIEDATVYKNMVVENKGVGKILMFEDGRPVVICGNGLIKIESAFYLVGDEKIRIEKYPKFRIKFK